MKITEPGVYDISSEDYHADPCPVPSLSSSLCKILIQETPQHAWTAHPRLNPDFVRKEKTIFDIGNAAHSLMLNDPKKFEIIDAPDWKTKAAKEARDKARGEGKIPMLANRWTQTGEMTSSGLMQLAAHKDAKDAFTDGKPEQTLIWQEGKTWFRVRLDWKPNKGVIYDDYKSTTSAKPASWARIAFNIGHDIQAAFYRRGIRALGLCENPRMRFIVQETSAPYALSVCEFGKQLTEDGEESDPLDLADRRISRALRQWEWCLANDCWPGYSAETTIISAPPWFENDIVNAEMARAAEARRRGKTDDVELLAEGIRFQAPL